MQNLINKISSIELKIKKLAEQQAYLKKENLMLIEENIKLRQQLQENKTQILTYINPNNEVISSAEMSNAPTGNESVLIEKHKAEIENIRTEIDQYITEIEKCIELAQFD